jgi:hypothetical protein
MHDFPDVLGGLVRLVRLVTWDLAWTGALRQLGRGVLLVLTLGRFPRGRQLERHGDLVACAGLLTLIAAWSAIALWNQRYDRPHAQVPPAATSPHSPPAGSAP